MLSFLFCGQTLRNCPSRNSTLFSSRRSTLLSQLRQRSFWTNFPDITGLSLQLKMVGRVNRALLFRYMEFPRMLSLFQYALFQRMWLQASASNMCSLAELCQGKRLRKIWCQTSHTGYFKGCANTCSPSAIDVCRDPSYKCEVSQLLFTSLWYWRLRSCGGILLIATITASFMYLFGYSVGYIG